jgi:hypothetical protein
LTVQLSAPPAKYGLKRLQIQEFISKSPFCVLATSNADGDCDASPKDGAACLLLQARILAVLLSLRIRRKLPFV